MARRRVSFDKDVVETRRWASSWEPHAIMMGAPGGVQAGHGRNHRLHRELNTRPGHVTSQFEFAAVAPMGTVPLNTLVHISSN